MTSGTYAFQPNLGSLFLSAFSRIQVKRTELTAQHLEDAKMEANYLQVEWSNQGLTLWTVDLQTIPLVQGTATYPIPSNTVMILDLYISTQSPLTNRLLMPISRTDYASLADPTQQAYPTSWWFDRLISPTITFWPIPDGNNTYTCNFYRYRNIQDAVPSQGGNPEIQYLWTDAYVAGLAHRLSRSYAPQLEQLRKADSQEAFAIASKQGVENVPIWISPNLQGYYRQ